MITGYIGRVILLRPAEPRARVCPIDLEQKRRQQRNLCLKAGGSTLLNDFAKTSMIGRIGQGLALLFSYSQGYRFTAHLSSHLTSIGVSSTGNNGRLLPIADFIFDGTGGARALVEAKASLSQSENNPSVIKALLKRALTKQIDPWMKKINPPATKAFVVSSYLREGTSKNCDPSTLVFVDPESEDEAGEVDITPETVRRENFAAWLSAMGLFRHAERLRNGESDNFEMVQFAIFKFGEREIAFPVIFGLPFFWEIMPPMIDPSPLFAAGIHIEALKAISQAAKGDGTLLLEYQGFDEAQEGQRNNASYSLFPDGTFFGKITNESFMNIVEFSL